MTEKLWQGVCALLLAACALLGYQWWDARTDATAAEQKQLKAEKLLAEEQAVTADQRTSINTQNDKLDALSKQAKAAEERAAALAAKNRAYEKRTKDALAEANKIDAGKVVSCDAAMPTLRNVLKGVRP